MRSPTMYDSEIDLEVVRLCTIYMVSSGVCYATSDRTCREILLELVDNTVVIYSDILLFILSNLPCACT